MMMVVMMMMVMMMTASAVHSVSGIPLAAACPRFSFWHHTEDDDDDDDDHACDLLNISMFSFEHCSNCHTHTPSPIRAGWSFFFKAVRHCLIETKWEVSRVTLKWSFLRTTYKTVQRSQRSKHCHFWRNWLFLLIKIQLAKKGQNFGKAPPPILFFRDPSLSHNLHANHVIEGSKTFTGKARISRNIFSESWYFRFREVKFAGCCIPRNRTPPCSCIGVASQAAAATAGKFN